MSFPKHIALYGYPKVGKTLVQTILEDQYLVVPVDDGAPLRDFAVDNLGLTREQVSTQAGKLETLEILGRVWQIRELLGELGNAYEAMFGKDIMPFMALARAAKMDAQSGFSYGAHSFSYGSVRRDQGRLYQRAGGIVIEVVNPSVAPSPYEFDQYDRSVVDYQIINDGLFRGMSPGEARADLRDKVRAVIAQHQARQAEAA